MLMGIAVESGMRHVVMFAIPAATPAHDPSDAASRGACTPEMSVREVS